MLCNWQSTAMLSCADWVALRISMRPPEFCLVLVQDCKNGFFRRRISRVFKTEKCPQPTWRRPKPNHEHSNLLSIQILHDAIPYCAFRPQCCLRSSRVWMHWGSYLLWDVADQEGWVLLPVRMLLHTDPNIIWKGNYFADIVRSLARAEQPVNNEFILNSRFLCTADEDFLIWVDKCADGECKDNGSGRDDTCSWKRGGRSCILYVRGGEREFMLWALSEEQ